MAGGIMAFRTARYLTQAELAVRWGVPLRSLQNWEQGTRRPRGRTIRAILVRDPAARMVWSLPEEETDV